MQHVNKNILFLVTVSFALCMIPASYSLASGDQDASKIAHALEDRLRDALNFKDEESTPRTFNVEVAETINNTFQDCVPFDPDNILIRRVNGRYRIIDGTHYLFDFGANRDNAQWAKAIIKYYGMNTTCFVGRPKSSFFFLLIPGETTIDIGRFYKIVVNGKTPEGDIPFPEQVNCTRFSPDQLRIKRDDGIYSIIDGSNQVQLFSFNQVEKDAVASLVFTRLYGFNQKCSIGGGQSGTGSQALPTFTYLTHVGEDKFKPEVFEFKK